MAESMRIYSVSNRLDRDNYQRTSSMGGGTMLYLKGIGLSPTSHNNVVMIGDKQCQIMASSEVYIQCYTISHFKEE